MNTNIFGVFAPLFGSQLTINETILDIRLKNPNLQQIRIFFESTPTSNKELPTGEFKIAYRSYGTETIETLLDTVQLNHARNFSSNRRDVAKWFINIDDDVNFNTTIGLWYYNKYSEKVFFDAYGEIIKIDYNFSNCIQYSKEVV